MSHITVERNRRRQMNEHLKALRSLTPSFYVKRGDQASIIGGAVEFIKEMQQLLRALEAKKQRRSVSPRSPPPAQPAPAPAKSLGACCNTAVADVEARISGPNVVLRTLSKRRPGQLVRLVAALERHAFDVLHLSVSSMDDTVLYCFVVKCGRIGLGNSAKLWPGSSILGIFRLGVGKTCGYAAAYGISDSSSAAACVSCGADIIYLYLDKGEEGLCEQKGEGAKSRGQLIERKIEALESLAGKVSNRRSRRWLNQRILIELVPRLKVEEIRGLFAPPPWGEDSPPSVFCMTDIGDWDSFRNIDMDKEVKLLQALEKSPRNKDVNNDKLVAMDAWRRIGYRTREAFKRSYLSELVEHYEEQIRAFICHTSDEDVLVLHVQDPFHRLLLHGVCEFYNLISITITSNSSKMIRIKKRMNSKESLPNISLSGFLKMAKDSKK
ncbi:hypothetical protein HPP92_015477 [Vanilla planifolia]|uniref:Uncharacterized protein n=1 Tax=Vanilla planifolia TaxID=51239 RepID=A0A835QLY0_VANPL|nr:hypothetical protein HPP92_015477 [Vanilla planifolia]